MKTYSKSLLIAIAAVAVTSTTAYAHNGILKRADLSDDQRAAIEQARELHQAGDDAAARDILLDAGFDEEALQKLRQARHHHAKHAAFKAQLEESLTEEQLQALQVAKAANDREAVHAILEEAGIERPARKHGKRRGHSAEQDEEQS